MDLILPFQIKSSPEKISYSQKLLFIGSCFTEEIGKQMGELKFDVLQNPNGILYDPRSIAYALNSYVNNKIYKADDLFLQDGIWHSWQHHSAFSGTDKNAVIENINQSQTNANVFLKRAEWMVITLGTSFHYQLKETQEYVANCHKVPANSFSKILMPDEETFFEFKATIEKLRAFNPNIKIIFTISPVRHVRDGVVENNRSKARLIEAVHLLTEKESNVFYFPAYELVIDVLRDYRFYKADLVHVTDVGVNFVFEKFCEAYVDDRSQKIMGEIKSLLGAVKHRPFQKESDKHKKFLETQLTKALSLQEKNPEIDLTREISYFSDEQKGR